MNNKKIEFHDIEYHFEWREIESNFKRLYFGSYAEYHRRKGEMYPPINYSTIWEKDSNASDDDSWIDPAEEMINEY